MAPVVQLFTRLSPLAGEACFLLRVGLKTAQYTMMQPTASFVQSQSKVFLTLLANFTQKLPTGYELLP